MSGKASTISSDDHDVGSKGDGSQTDQRLKTNLQPNPINMGGSNLGSKKSSRQKGGAKKKVYSCQMESCTRADSNAMVQCDKCHSWWHYKCVGVDKSISEKPWSCVKCSDKKTVSSRRSVTSSVLRAQIQRAEEEKQMRDKLAEEEKALKLKRIEEEKLAKEKVDLEFLERQRKSNEEFLNSKYNISLTGSSVASSEIKPRTLHERTKEWVQKLPRHNNIVAPCEKNRPQSTPNRFLPTNNNTFNIPDVSSHIVARQVLGKIDLPIFGGDPLDWPMFISTFKQTTDQCGYTNTENLLRLQKSLRGEALELVRSSLVYSDSVPLVIQSLKQMYGQPETILSRLIQRIRSMPAIRSDRFDMLIRFSIESKNLYSTIVASELAEHLNNPMLRQELVEKLPYNLKLKWGFYRQQTNDSSLFAFNNWLATVAEAASLCSPDVKPIECKIDETKTISPKQKKGSVRKVQYQMSVHTAESKDHTIVAGNIKSCVICDNDGHTIEKCGEFLKLTPGKRMDKIAELRLCRTCLGRHSSYCDVHTRCGVDGCRRFHNALLHKSTSQSNASNLSKAVSIQHHQIHQSILYRIVPVFLYHKSKRIKTLAMFDEGSSSTFIDESMAESLQLDGPTKSLKISWTSDVSRIEENSKVVSFRISGINEGDSIYHMKRVHTVKSLHLPTQAISSDDLSKYPHMKNVAHRISSYCEGCPTILIGLDQYKLTLPLEVYEGSWNDPIATRSRLGWTVCGPNQHEKLYMNIHEMQHEDDHDLHLAVKDFFSLDSFGVGSGILLDSKDDERAKQIMNQTMKYSNGRYEIGLLWRQDNSQIPKSRDMALRRLLCFENKLKKNVTLLKAVNEKLDEYIVKGYAEKLTVNQISSNHTKVWYLPIFAVQNANKPSKLRIVWDAAAKSHGTSLNDFLLKGPDNMAPLLEILFRFREKPVAISGDIREMFHQVVVSEEDRHVQRFLWRQCDQKKEPEEFVLRVLTFGATCSPSLAQHVKNEHAMKYSDRFPRAVQEIKVNHYVDDWLSSFNTPEEALIIAKQVQMIHSEAGFDIRNWLSNNHAVVQNLCEMHEEVKFSENHNKLLNSLEGNIDKVLGMMWCTREDVFIFRVNKRRVDKHILSGERLPTKREVLSIVMSTFDPLGLVASFIIQGKIILQDIWRQGTEWDETINYDTGIKWNKWIGRLFSIEVLKIPRCYMQDLKPDQIITYDLHIFMDASQEAYSATAYLRICRHDYPIVECTLLSAKTKVAPQKPTSIPRLELLAAVLGVRLMNTIVKAHTFEFRSKTLWSDSTTVLSWMKSDVRRYKPFVAFRISECLESTDAHEWRYVPSKLNVADEATKWYNEDGLTTSRWFDGPDFLLKEETYWPRDLSKLKEEMEEMRAHLLIHSVKSKFSPNVVVVNEMYSNSWMRTVRSQAFFERSIINFKLKKNSRVTGPLLVQDLKNAETSLIKKAQWDVYKDEISTLMLNTNSNVDSSSPIKTYSPYVDEFGVLRMRGRIDKAQEIRDETKRPVIMPKDHVITFKIVDHYHRVYLHQNHESVINEIRQLFVIPQIRVLYKIIRQRCQYCKLLAAKPQPPAMGDLPADRLLVNIRPFSIVGVDYFGPIEVVVGRHVEKRWGVLYTCMSVRAIHLEIVNSLTTDSCIRSLIMFMARRGTPKRIYSDNATNFRGTNNVLQAELRKLNTDDMLNKFSNIEWRFIPPVSPHFGGAWERLVRTVKRNMYIALPERKVSEEILRACMAEVEMIINSRPLTHVPIDHEDAEAITPNHLILGSSSGIKPLCIEDESYIPNSRSWKISQMFADRFWRRFIREYLPDLARRTKWNKSMKPLQVDDLVLIVDEKNDRGRWPRGKIVDVLYGNDGQVRRAVVKTQEGLYTRPAVKLALIDVTGSQSGSLPLD